MEASQQDKIIFVKEFLPHAEDAATRLGVGPAFVLAQWALESGWGLEYPHGSNNIAGITRAVDGVLYSFGSWAEMNDWYVGSMQKDCPNINQHRTTAESGAVFILEHTTYNTANPNYASEIQSIMAEVEPIVAEIEKAKHAAAQPPAAPASTPNEPTETAAVEKKEKELTHIVLYFSDGTNTTVTINA